jgi:hypothetical protein
MCPRLAWVAQRTHSVPRLGLEATRRRYFEKSSRRVSSHLTSRARTRGGAAQRPRVLYEHARGKFLTPYLNSIRTLYLNSISELYPNSISVRRPLLWGSSAFAARVR